MDNYTFTLNFPTTNVNVVFNMIFDTAIAAQGSATAVNGTDSVFKPGTIALSMVSVTDSVTSVEALSFADYTTGNFFIRFYATTNFLNNIVVPEFSNTHTNATTTFYEIFFNTSSSAMNISDGVVGATATIPTISLTPVSNVCFVGSTLIDTDQGKIPIESMDSSVNTIYGKEIQAITKTVLTDSYLVKLEKDCIDVNVPNQTTILSPSHQVFYRGSLVPAKNIQEGIHIPYDGRPMYNIVLEEYRVIQAHNLYIETLYPKNNTAILFKNLAKRNSICA